MERRQYTQDVAGVRLEERADEASKISGYASVFYDGTKRTEYQLWDGAVERIMPGSFDDAIKNDDVRALFNHDPNQVLGRTQSDTLKLSVDKRGLKYEIEPGDTQVARDVSEHIRRGDVDGSSFAFIVTDSDWRTEDSVDIREIRSVELYDVGPVTYPAYSTTTAESNASGLQVARRSHDVYEEEKEEKEKQKANRSSYKKLAEAIEIDVEQIGSKQ